MRLISWNIEHPTESTDVENVLRVLREAKPDLVAFQEVPRRVPQELVEGLSESPRVCWRLHHLRLAQQRHFRRVSDLEKTPGGCSLQEEYLWIGQSE